MSPLKDVEFNPVIPLKEGKEHRYLAFISRTFDK